MRILVIILSIMIFMKTFTYGLYELKDCKNKKSAILYKIDISKNIRY